MNSFDINTSQNVVINYEIASVGDRIIAYIIDSLIKAGYVIFIALVFVGAFSKSGAFWLLGLFFLPVLFYSLLFEIFMQGQTPGKRSRNIKVVMLDGSQAGFSAYLIRWLFRIVDINLFSGIIAIVTITVNKKGQRVGDIVAQTTVIKIQDRVSLKDTLYEKLNSDYVVTYADAKKLDSEDVELIKKVLNTPDYRNNFEMVYSLTNRIQAKMNVVRTEGPEDFLETVVKDYNHLYDE